MHREISSPDCIAFINKFPRNDWQCTDSDICGEKHLRQGRKPNVAVQREQVTQRIHRNGEREFLFLVENFRRFPSCLEDEHRQRQQTDNDDRSTQNGATVCAVCTEENSCSLGIAAETGERFVALRLPNSGQCPNDNQTHRNHCVIQRIHPYRRQKRLPAVKTIDKWLNFRLSQRSIAGKIEETYCRQSWPLKGVKTK